MTVQNCVRIPHIIKNSGPNQNLYTYSGYQMPHATTETGQNSLPRPEFNNNDPFHPVPGSMVGPSLVPSIPPYSNQTYTCAYPIQPTYVNHGNANFGLWQEGPGFRPYVFNAQSC